MPETEGESLEQEYEQELARGRIRIGELFDRAVKEDRSPIDILREESKDFQGLRDLYGSEAVDTMLEQLPSVPIDDRQKFEDGVTDLAAPMIRLGVFDPEVRARIEAFHNRNNQEVFPTGPLDEPHLLMKIRSVGMDLPLPDGTKLQPDDRVMEIIWPEQDIGPRGAKEVIKALRAMAVKLETQPELRAVTAVSWMVSRAGLMERLGFHVIPNAPIPEQDKVGSAERGQRARSDKPYQQGVRLEDVKFAFIPRAEFLERYLSPSAPEVDSGE